MAFGIQPEAGASRDSGVTPRRAKLPRSFANFREAECSTNRVWYTLSYVSKRNWTPSVKDFFISYTEVDRQWAEWIAHTLEAAGFTTIIQAWDFRPGHNFALEMKSAAAAAKRTLVVLSPAYLRSKYAASEWAAAFAKDPDGKDRGVIPVRVQPCEVEGLQRPIIYIDLIGLSEGDARDELLRGVREGRAKPIRAPQFPGATKAERKPHLPNSVPHRTPPVGGSVYLPNVPRAATDADKRRFIKQAFETLRAHFEVGLRELDDTHGHIEIDFQLINATEFRAEIFIDGRSASCSRFWQGTLFGGDGISVPDGRSSGHNSCNESLFVESSQDGELYLKAGMRSLGGDDERMNPAAAADYLWRRFLKPLEFHR